MQFTHNGCHRGSIPLSLIHFPLYFTLSYLTLSYLFLSIPFHFIAFHSIALHFISLHFITTPLQSKETTWVTIQFVLFLTIAEQKNLGELMLFFTTCRSIKLILFKAFDLMGE